MFQVDLKSRKAIYEQVVENFKDMIMTGMLKPDEKIPSVRDLAKELTINPNTIQKAYRELEKMGYLYSVSGRGSFVAMPTEQYHHSARIEELKELLSTSLSELCFLQCPREEIWAVLEEAGFATKGEDDT